MKALIEVTVANDLSKITVDFDTVQMVSPQQMKIRGTDGKMAVHTGTAIRFRTREELQVTETYETITEQWIKLNHPCVHKCLQCGATGPELIA